MERVTDTNLVKPLFGDWEETMIYSCLQGIMGELFVAEPMNPKSVMAVLGDFVLLAGEPSEKLVQNKPNGFKVVIPQNEGWSALIEKCYPGHATRVTRYAIKKNTCFDRELLEQYKKELPEGYTLAHIDEKWYEECKEGRWSGDLVASFDSKEEYLKKGLGMVVVKGTEIVAGASSYSRYLEGIEIEVDTKPEERRKHLATAVSAALILECLNRGLYPSWDAQNLWSVSLAQKLGYEFSHEYVAYEVTDMD